MVKRDGGQTGWWSNWIGWEVVSMQHIGQTKMVKRSNENGARSKSLRGSRCVHERVPAHNSGQIGQWSKMAACTSACWQDSERKRASGCDGGRGAVKGEGEGPSCLASGQWSNRTVVKVESGHIGQCSNRTVVKRARLVSRGCRSGAVPRVSPAIQHPPLRVSPLGPAPASHARLRPCPPRAPLRPTRMSAAGPGPPQPCRPGSVRACSVQADAPHASARLPPLLPPPPP